MAGPHDTTNGSSMVCLLNGILQSPFPHQMMVGHVGHAVRGLQQVAQKRAEQKKNTYTAPLHRYRRALPPGRRCPLCTGKFRRGADRHVPAAVSDFPTDVMHRRMSPVEEKKNGRKERQKPE